MVIIGIESIIVQCAACVVCHAYAHKCDACCRSCGVPVLWCAGAVRCCCCFVHLRSHRLLLCLDCLCGVLRHDVVLCCALLCHGVVLCLAVQICADLPQELGDGCTDFVETYGECGRAGVCGAVATHYGLWVVDFGHIHP